MVRPFCLKDNIQSGTRFAIGIRVARYEIVRTPRVGMKPTTKGLTVPCSTAELPRNIDSYTDRIYNRDLSAS